MKLLLALIALFSLSGCKEKQPQIRQEFLISLYSTYSVTCPICGSMISEEKRCGIGTSVEPSLDEINPNLDDRWKWHLPNEIFISCPKDKIMLKAAENKQLRKVEYSYELINSETYKTISTHLYKTLKWEEKQ